MILLSVICSNQTKSPSSYYKNFTGAMLKHGKHFSEKTDINYPQAIIISMKLMNFTLLYTDTMKAGRYALAEKA